MRGTVIKMDAFNESHFENGVDKNAPNDYNGSGFKSELEPFRNVKDSVFKRLFTDPKYLLQMYQTLHPEDKDTEAEDLNIVTLETVIIKDIQNDLGFTAGSELVILAEAQSTWSVNIVVRGLLYLAQTYRNYIRTTNQNIYGPKPLDIPRAELYVIYTGTSKVTKEEITLSEEFFNGIPCSIETKIKVILEDEGNDIINQYILFSKIMDEQIRIYGSENKNEAVKEAFRICKERNILKEFIECHEAGEPAHLKCASRMGQAYVLS